ELAKVPGIGKGLGAHIAEYLETGGIGEIERLRCLVPPGLLALLELRGLGPKTAKLLHDHLGIDNLEKLERMARSGEILAVPGIRDKMRDNILQSLATHRAGQLRLPLGRAVAVAEAIVLALRATRAVDRIEVAGSSRRRRDTVGDLDILVTSRQPERVIETFVALRDVRRVLARGDTKTSILHGEAGAPELQVDLRVVEPESYGAALQYFTGSKDHNVRLRELAQRRGLKISEYGVFDEKTGARVAGAEEAEVYAAVGLPWIPPELRENTGEIEAALAGTLPPLVEIGDLKGDLHAHTDWSDGHLPLARLVEAAEARGYEYVIVSDHSRSSAVAGGLTPDELREQIKAIRALQPRHRIRILAGSECDVLPDGRLDFPDDLLRELDVVVAAVHSRFTQPREEMTARITRALEHPDVHVLAHPTGRLIGERDPYDVDLDRVLAAARAHGKVVEINGSPHRLDLKDSHARRAAELGVGIAISSDTHDLAHLDRVALGVAIARRGWVPAALVVNTLPLDALLARLRARVSAS
ncbi:MAG: DNA polymerase/3'-5' exonuclease PolX, partial [Candidatus Rokubacteria bacterium]|nr:DNA polymerase/3'-5' exonuclease PolX [Candidatus Rokubacteria bacterium]